MTPARSQSEYVLDNVRHAVRRVLDVLHALFGFGIKPGSGRHSHHHLAAQRGSRVAVAQLRGRHTDRRQKRKRRGRASWLDGGSPARQNGLWPGSPKSRSTTGAMAVSADAVSVLEAGAAILTPVLAPAGF